MLHKRGHIWKKKKRKREKNNKIEQHNSSTFHDFCSVFSDLFLSYKCAVNHAAVVIGNYSQLIKCDALNRPCQM